MFYSFILILNILNCRCSDQTKWVIFLDAGSVLAEVDLLHRIETDMYSTKIDMVTFKYAFRFITKFAPISSHPCDGEQLAVFGQLSQKYICRKRDYTNLENDIRFTALNYRRWMLEGWSYSNATYGILFDNKWTSIIMGG